MPPTPPVAATPVKSISTTNHSWVIRWGDGREDSQVICLGVSAADDTVIPMIQADDGNIVSAYTISPDFRMVMMSA